MLKQLDYSIEISSSECDCSIETRVKVSENEKCCGYTSRQASVSTAFHGVFELSQTFTSVEIETRRSYFLLLLENWATKTKKASRFALIIKMQILFARTIT